MGDGEEFKNGHHLAAWLGLVPRHCASGDRRHLFGISKHGDQHLRTLLIHGARAVVRTAHSKSGPRYAWVQALHRGTNRTIVALANKNARILWVLLAKGESYRKVVEKSSGLNGCEEAQELTTPYLMSHAHTMTRKPKLNRLTPRQKLFALEYLKDLCATQAAIRAGYSAKTAEQAASRLLRNAKVAAEIQKAMNSRAERVKIDADQVLQELARLAFANVMDYIKT